MALDRENELKCRKALADLIATVPEAGYVVPAARYSSGIEDFWAVADPTKDTRNELETSLIAATWVYPLIFSDDFTSGGHDSPLVRFSYEIYLFRQYGLEREDESETPIVFDSKVLKEHNDFIAAWLGIKEAFQREAVIAELDPAVFAERKTGPVVQIENIANQAVCEFVPGAVGYAVRLQETLRLKLREC